MALKKSKNCKLQICSTISNCRYSDLSNNPGKFDEKTYLDACLKSPRIEFYESKAPAKESVEEKLKKAEKTNLELAKVVFSRFLRVQQ
jgi:hypothetical protein